MTEQSQFSKLPKKQLVLIAEKLVDESFPSGNPYDEREFEEYYKLLEGIGKYFSISVIHEDVEFFSKFLEMNDELLSKIFDPNGYKTLIDKLIIPVAQTYELLYSTWGSCTYDEYMAKNLILMIWIGFWIPQNNNEKMVIGTFMTDIIQEKFNTIILNNRITVLTKFVLLLIILRNRY